MQIKMLVTCGVAGYDKAIKRGTTVQVHDVQEAKALIAQGYAEGVEAEDEADTAIEDEADTAPPVITSDKAPKSRKG